MKHDIIIERAGRRYRLDDSATDCTRVCSFARKDSPDGKCERKCYLPNWFTRIHFGGACLKEISKPERRS